MSESAATLVTGLLGAAVGFIAVVAAGWGVISARTIARRQTTMDLIMALRTDATQRAARQRYNQLVRDPGGLEGYAAKDKEGSPETTAIAAVFNEYELISVGIQMGIIDPELYKRFSRTNVLLSWKNAQGFVVALRQRLDQPTLYHEFEELAREFNQNKVPRRRFWWAGII